MPSALLHVACGAGFGAKSERRQVIGDVLEHKLKNPLLVIVSLLSMVTVLAGHFISAANHTEVYVICAVSYWIRLASLLTSLTGATGMAAFASIGLGLLVFVFITLMAVGLLTSIVLGIYLIVSRRPNSLTILISSGIHLTLGVLICSGLLLVIFNRDLTNMKGADKIYLSPLYFGLPALFFAYGSLLWVTYRKTLEPGGEANQPSARG